MTDNTGQDTWQALTEAASQDERLTAYYTFQRSVLEHLDEARDRISAELKLADEAALRSRLTQGLPLISFDQLPVDEGTFGELAFALAQLLLDYDSDLEDEKLPETAAQWYALARQRFDENRMERRHEEPNLVQMAVDLALRPYLTWVAERVMEHVEQGLWGRGDCPVCGGSPNFATLDGEKGARHLVCSRCDSQWVFPRLRCPFCGTSDHTKLAYYPGDDGVYRLYVCEACKSYLKTIDLRQVSEEIDLTVERITTVAMDAAAIKAGYGQ